MARVLKFAIDSRPLSADAISTYDYSGSQVYGLTTTPLSHLAAEMRTGSKESCNVAVAPGRTWSDGVPINPSQYLDGIRRVAGTNAFVGRYLLRKVKSIRVAGENLEFTMHRPNYRLREVLSIPNFVPFRSEPGIGSGEFVFEHRTEDHIALRSKDGDEVQILVVKEPEHNLELYHAGQLDLTSDTAFPYYRYAEYQNSRELHACESGLYAALVFGQRLWESSALPLRHFIQQAAESCDFTPVTFGVCRPIRNLHGGPAPLADAPAPAAPLRELRLAYDDFYPNREICEVIAGTLENLSVSTTVVQDDYYTPGADFDVKFSILRGLGDTPYLRYAGALFTDVFAQMPEARGKYAVFLDRLESAQSTEEQETLHEALALVLREAVALVPLFSIPSTYLSKLEGGRNPLIANAGVA